MTEDFDGQIRDGVGHFISFHGASTAPEHADRHALALVAASLLNAHHLTVDERRVGWIALQTLLKESK